jgi:hypothetical protein
MEEREKEQLKGGIYITAKDIQILNNCSSISAHTEHRTVRDILGIAKKKLTVFAYCEYYKLDYQLVISYLNPYR